MCDIYKCEKLMERGIISLEPNYLTDFVQTRLRDLHGVLLSHIDYFLVYERL